MGSTQFAGFDVGRKDCWMIFPEDLKLVTDKESPFYDYRVELPVKDSLVEDMMLHGVIETVTVRKDGSDIIVIDGRQRVKAAIEANKRRKGDKIRVPCIVQRGEDVDLFGTMCSANEHRTDDDTMRKAEKAARFVQGGKTEAEAAVVFGVSANTIKNWLKLLDLSAPVRNAVKAGKIAPSAAAKLASLSTEEQKRVLDEAIEFDAMPRERSTPRNLSSKGAASLARSMRAKKGERPRSVRRKEEVEEVLKKYPAAPFNGILRWFLGEGCDFAFLAERMKLE